MKNVTVVAFILTLVVAGNASSDVTVNAYQKMKTVEPSVAKLYVDAQGTALLWANSELDLRKQPLLYCQPPHLALNADNYVDILERSIKQDRARIDDRIPITYFLLNGLIKAFPCKK